MGYDASCAATPFLKEASMSSTRFLLAFVLSLVVLIGYPYVISWIYGPPEVKPSSQEEFSKEEITPPSLPEPEKGVELKEVADDTSELMLVETEKLRIFIHPKEGSIRSVYLKGYQDKSGELLELVKVGNNVNGIGRMWFKYPKNIPVLYDKVEQSTQKIHFRGVLLEGLEVERGIEFPTPYSMRLSATFLNRSSQTFPLYYNLVAASGLYPEIHDERDFEAVAFHHGRRQAFHLNQLVKKTVSSERPEWVALKTKYFSLILKPETDLSSFTFTSTEDKKSMVLQVWSTPRDIPPGERVMEEYLFYFGPNQLHELKKLGRWAEGVVHFGWFGGITKFMLWALTLIYRLVKNYGLAIVLLTILISILFLPLMRVSYNSMKRMKLLQPEIQKIRAAYKDKPQKMNKEIMDLYKRNKVNPMSGCFPMIVQMPIFIAMYQALIYSIELKGASFLFIKDLSLPDRAIPLPFQIGPLGDAINVLPLLMMGAMYLQQKLSAPQVAEGPEGESQRLMTSLMPLVFGFIFYGLPSGLVLYWLTNNIVMILTQKFLFSRGEVG